MNTRILVVDDEPQLEYLFQQKFRKNIRNKEFELSFALNGMEALEKLEADKDIDIVLSDINMPEMDGLTFISKLDEINPMIKTVMVSAYGNMQNIRSAMNNGAYDFVIKPIDFADLEKTIKRAVKELEIQKLAARTREKLSRLEQELLAARELQQSILPKQFDIFSEAYPYELCAEMHPAKEVGGDFYDFFLLDDHQLALIIGDVSGKGMASAIFMAISRGLLKAIARRGYSPADCLAQVNQLLSRDNPSCMFVTLFYGVVDLSTGQMTYCNGGHNWPYILTKEGTVAPLTGAQNIALGVVEDAVFEAGTTVIEAGQQLLLYTDGITEAVDAAFEEFSQDRLLAHLSKQPRGSAKEIIRGLIGKVEEFVDGTPASDDITTLVLRRMA